MVGEETVKFLLLIVDLGDEFLIEKRRRNWGEFVFLGNRVKGLNLIKSGTECDISGSLSGSIDGWDVVSESAIVHRCIRRNWVGNQRLIRRIPELLRCIHQRNARFHLGIVNWTISLTGFRKISLVD